MYTPIHILRAISVFQRHAQYPASLPVRLDQDIVSKE